MQRAIVVALAAALGGLTTAAAGLPQPADVAAPEVTARTPEDARPGRATGKPVILTLAESASFTATPEDGPVILYVSDEELVDAMRHHELRPGPAPLGPGFDVIPLPGDGGNLIVPRCGPCETPRLNRGRPECVPRPSRECDGVPEIDEPQPPPAERTRCHWQATRGRFGACEGRCGRFGDCEAIWYVKPGPSMRCSCQAPD